jgi:hypothetical protein
MFYPSHPPPLNHYNYTSQRVKVRMLLIIPPVTLSPLWPKYSPQHPVLKTPSVYVPHLLSQTKFYTHMEPLIKLQTAEEKINGSGLNCSDYQDSILF